MFLIRELTEDLKYFEELDEATQKKNLYIEGATLVADTKNSNNRIYPKIVLIEAIKRHKEQFMDSGRAMGELNHPDTKVNEINLDNVSHRFVSVTEDGNNFRTKALVLGTPKGLIVKNLINGGVKLGISSRGFGQVTESNGVTIVKALNLITLGDIVANPSAPGAFVQGVMESQEWVYENGVLVEKEKEIEEDLDSFKKAIKKAPKSMIEEVSISCFKEYFNTLLGK